MTSVRIYKSSSHDHRLIVRKRRPHGRPGNAPRRWKLSERMYFNVTNQDGTVPVKGKVRNGWQQVNRRALPDAI